MYRSYCIYALLVLIVHTSAIFPRERPGCALNGTVSAMRADYIQRIGFLAEESLLVYDPYRLSAPIYSVGIAVHIITDAAGNFGVAPADLAADINLLFSTFRQQVKIQFDIVKQDTIANDDYVYTTREEEEQISFVYNIPNVVNIYYIPHPHGDEQGRSVHSPILMSWYNNFSNFQFNGQYIIVKATRQFSSTLTHEMGHFFDLFHTYHTCLGDSATFPNQYESGDLIPDTPVADPEMIYDCNSPPNSSAWKIAHNFMSAYSSSDHCRDRFTRIQAQMMR
ncbi:hypothetical protein D6779_02770, partial [Candidatus Parcubacteria bacterium]